MELYLYWLIFVKYIIFKSVVVKVDTGNQLSEIELCLINNYCVEELTFSQGV